jgi:hypothetical protein
MTRIDTLRAIAAICRGSHASALLAVGWLTLEMSQEGLDDLLVLLQDNAGAQELLGHLEAFKRLHDERWSGSSRLS